MPTLTIDGKEITVPKGTTVIQAAKQLGIDIPRYCYHPGLSIVGQCRICLVEIEKMPKLQVACYTPVMDGMVVHTQSDKAMAARRQVLEFLLINHPIDCPVCDQAGECWLQEYYMKFGLYDSRMTEDKVKKNKVVPLGPHVMLDSERCILCSRCVRFCDEISKTHELGIFNRGDHAELTLYPGLTLDNPYSANVVDICPVGALTERDFRFNVRVWYLEETKSVCPGCSTGCNITIYKSNEKRSYKNDGRRIARLKPRENLEVNDYWMCDSGRYGFLNIEDESRIETPRVRSNGSFQNIGWDEALDEIATAVSDAKTAGKGIAVLGSPQMTNEDLFALKRFAGEFLEVESISVRVDPLEKPFSDDFLIREDKNPNTKGAELLGFSTAAKDTAALLKMCSEGKVAILFLFHHDLFNGFAKDVVEKALAKVQTVIQVASNENATSKLATYVLPACTYAEKDGTFTNYASRVQKINAALEPIGESRPEWQILRNLSRRLGQALPYFEAEDVFRELSRELPAFTGMSYAKIGDSGMIVQLSGKDAKKRVAAEGTVVAE